MIKNLAQQKEQMLQQILVNSKTFCSTKNEQDTKWKEFKVKKHKIGTNKVNKYDYCVLMIMIFVLDYGVHTFASFYNNLRK